VAIEPSKDENQCIYIICMRIWFLILLYSVKKTLYWLVVGAIEESKTRIEIDWFYGFFCGPHGYSWGWGKEWKKDIEGGKGEGAREEYEHNGGEKNEGAKRDQKSGRDTENENKGWLSYFTFCKGWEGRY